VAHKAVMFGIYFIVKDFRAFKSYYAAKKEDG
jgi:hypothetical protein